MSDGKLFIVVSQRRQKNLTSQGIMIIQAFYIRKITAHNTLSSQSGLTFLSEQSQSIYSHLPCPF